MVIKDWVSSETKQLYQLRVHLAAIIRNVQNMDHQELCQIGKSANKRLRCFCSIASTRSAHCSDRAAIINASHPYLRRFQ